MNNICGPFRRVSEVCRSHGHEGHIVMVVEGHKKDLKAFEECSTKVRALLSLKKE